MSESDDNSCQLAELLADELFEYCISDDISEEGIHQIIERHKESTPDNSHEVSDYQFFRAACSDEKVTEGIIQCLLKYFPAAANYPDHDGLLPIHYACGNNYVSLGIIQLLIDAAPDSIRCGDSNSYLPLHKLCSNKELDEATALQILKLLLEKYPESIQHCENNQGYLPIHVAACHMTNSNEFCRVLIDAYPGSERIADSTGWLPFHHACTHNTVEMVKYLYNLFPEAIHHAAQNGVCPIHTAIATLDVGADCTNPQCVDIVKFLLSCGPMVKYQRCWDGQSLLAYACSMDYESNIGAALDIFEIICDSNPDFIREEDSKGCLPLHTLCGTPSQDETSAIAILRLLLKKYPDSVRHMNNNGFLPIHVAVVDVKSPEFFRVLIEAYPGSERIPTNNVDVGGLLPFHCACMKSSLAAVEYLYKLYPDAINHAPDGLYLYPIHAAIRSVTSHRRDNPEAAVDIVKFLLDCDPRVKFQKFGGITPNLSLACLLDYTDTSIDTGLEIIGAVFDANPEEIEHESFMRDDMDMHPQVRAFVNSQLDYSRQASDSHLMTTPDVNGELPLHTALQLNARLGSIILLAKGNPVAVHSSDNNGALPLHVACMYYESASVVQYLVELDTATLEAVDHENNTPLHYACNSPNYEAISLLLEKYDAVSISKRNTEGKLPIEVLWEYNELARGTSTEQTESVFRLLRAYPEMMNVSMSCE